MLANTWLDIPAAVSSGIVTCSKHALSATLFLIGCGISVQSIRNTGIRPFALGISLWIIISLATLAVTMAV